MLDRLEKLSLIVRRPDPDDGRSRLIEVSEQGLATRRKMWPIYRRVIEGSIGERLTAPQAIELAGLLAPVAASDEPSAIHGASA